MHKFETENFLNFTEFTFPNILKEKKEEEID
jgi:hypothetical protein